MIPEPLQRHDRFYAHIPADAMDRFSLRGALARVSFLRVEPVIPYVLCNPDSVLTYPDYYEALGTLGLSEKDVVHNLKPGARGIYRDPLKDPEGGHAQRYLKWAAYVSPGESHVVLEVGGTHQIAGFCFAKKPDGRIVLDQMFAGDMDVHHTLDLNNQSRSAVAVRDAVMMAAKKAIDDLRHDPEGSEDRFDSIMHPVMQFIARNDSLAVVNQESLISVAAIGKNLQTLAGRLNHVADHKFK